MYRQPQEGLFVCMDCGARATAAGECGACGQGPLLDASKPDIRLWLLEEDERRRQERDRKLLWPSVLLSMVVGLPLIVVTKDVIASIFVMIFVALGLWRLAAKLLAPRPRHPYLRDG